MRQTTFRAPYLRLRPASGDVFERAAAADAVAIAGEYARLAGAGAGVDGSRIIEKLPLNYLYLGAIHRALPEAKLLLVRRSPLDSCFAMYRTLFAAGYPFSYDLAELGRYYLAYEHLVNHWRAVFGDRMHEIVYEDLVNEPSRVGQAIATHCGLQWSESAIDIQRNASVSLTASASQVRRPIYGSSSGRWRHYRRHLEPLMVTLRDSTSADLVAPPHRFQCAAPPHALSNPSTSACRHATFTQQMRWRGECPMLTRRLEVGVVQVPLLLGPNVARHSLEQPIQRLRSHQGSAPLGLRSAPPLDGDLFLACCCFCA